MRVRSVVGFLVLAVQGGCLTGPRRVEYSARLIENQPNQLWLNLNDGREVVVRGPKVMADTVFGWTERGNGNEEIAVAISDVKEMRARQVSAFRTALIPVSFAVGLTTGVVMIKKIKGEPLAHVHEIGEEC